MIVINEEQSAAFADHALAFAAVRTALIDAAQTAKVFPALIAHGSAPTNRISIKSAAGPALAGVKIGAFWPDNPARGLPRHNSTVVLIDQQTGRIAAVIEAAKLNAFRTAAADAVAASVLARADSRVIGLFGAGHQGEYECRALAQILPIDTVLVVGRDPARSQDFCQRLQSIGLEAYPTDAETACRQADLIVTATPSRAALFDASWVRPGTHIAAMGADGVGKQELPPALLAKTRNYCDLASQSVSIGEFQHVADAIASGDMLLTAIGDVITGGAAGRQSDADITVFDSSGMALQDLYVGQAVLERFLDQHRLS